jgi:hypothetical protein
LKIRLFFLKLVDFPVGVKYPVQKIDVKILFINEAGLYSLIVEFQKWVTLALKSWCFHDFFAFLFTLENQGIFTIFFAFLLTLENRGVLP